MNFKTNLNTFSLLGNERIKFYFDDKIVEFDPPNLRLYVNDIEFNYVRTLMSYTVDDFNKAIPKSYLIVENSYDVLLAFLKLELNKDLILKYIQLLFPNLVYHDNNFFVEESMLVYDEYKILLDAILVSCAEKDIKDFFKEFEPKVEEKIDPAIKRMREAEERIKQIKQKGKKLQNGDTKNKTKDEKGITIDQIVIAVIYEFNFSIAEVYDMNMFTLLHFWTYVSKVIDTQIQIVAAGNGLTKEFTYFIN